MADKTKSIKAQTDQELNDLIIRLRKECEVQGLISDLKRRATPDSSIPTDTYGNRIYDYSVSTEMPIEDMYHNEAVDNVLAHFGVLGMKWGHRKGNSGANVYLQRAKKIVGFGGIHHLPAAERKLHDKIKSKIDTKKQEHAKTYSDEFKQTKELKKKNYKQMSNKELKALNERMQLERTMRDLKSSDYQKGFDVVKTITAAGTTVATLYALSTSPLGQAIKKAITKS